MKKVMQLGKSLSREQQKQILGGFAQCSCSCTQNTGEWSYDNGAQPPATTIAQDVNAYCTGMGTVATCSGCTNWSS